MCPFDLKLQEMSDSSRPHHRRLRRIHDQRKRRRRHRRRPIFEPLEQRRLLATFVVNSTSLAVDSYLDDGICDTAFNPTTDPPTPKSNVCTLTAASQQAAASPDFDRITFDIPVADGVVPVIPTSAFIAQGAVEIDGTTQPAGRVSVRGVNIQGSGGSLVKGLVVRELGIQILSPNNTIVNNFVGTSSDGTALVSSVGIQIRADGNSIGGPDASDRNIFTTLNIDGNDNTIVGNYIGVDVTGEAPLGTGNISIDNGTGNSIGGETFSLGNVIRGTVRIVGIANNANRAPRETLIQNNRFGTNKDGTTALPYPGPGVLLAEADDTAILDNTLAAAVGPPDFFGAASGIYISNGADRTTIEGNQIGTDISGTVVDPDGTPGTGDEFGNKDFGIIVNGQGVGATDNTIGGTTPDKANVISGNGTGIQFSNQANGNTIVGNYIGTDATGTAALPNAVGIEILFAASNVIGGTRPNIIAGNAGNGVVIAGNTATDNLVAGNRIGTNEDGDAPIPNEHGILINDAPQNCIGGVIPSSDASGLICETTTGVITGNLISGNEKFGIQIANANASGNLIQANMIGTDPTGMTSDPDGTPASGDELGNGWDGVALQAGASRNTVGGSQPSRRNIISGNQGDGVLIIGVDGNPSELNVISGNYIGVDASGAQGIGNGARGVHINAFATQNVIGGDLGNDRNIISGNGSDGVLIFSPSAQNNTVKNNYIGTDKLGAAAVPNTENGIFLWRSANNSIGEIVDTTAIGNIISGNREAGVRIEDATATENALIGNSIGTDAAGTAAIGNEGPGVLILNAPRNTIGGAFADSPLSPTYPGNVISGNSAAGVAIGGAEAQSNFLGANLIGTDRSGTRPLGNGDHGIHIFGAPDTRIGQSLVGEPALTGNTISRNAVGIRIEQPAASGTIIGDNKIGTAYDGSRDDSQLLGNVLSGIQVIEASDTLIGGVAFDGNGNAAQVQPNVISQNLRGVRIEGDSAQFNTIQRNAIYGNRQTAIDLGRDGTTPNDPLDADTGPNTLLNSPEIRKLSADQKVTVGYEGAPNTVVKLDIYQSESAGGDDGGQGQIWLQEVTTTTDANGMAEVVVPIPFDSAYPFLTATATDIAGNTSEFAGPLRLPDLTIDPFSIFPNDVIRNGSRFILPYAITVRNVGTARATNATVRITGNGVPLGLSGGQVSLDPAESITISGEWDVTDILIAGTRGVGSIELATIVDPADRIEELPIARNDRSASTDLDGRPIIVRLNKEFADGIFLQGVTLDNQIDVYVDWNGNLDGITVEPNHQPRVFVRLNGIEQLPIGDTSLIEAVPTSFSFDMGSDLAQGPNDLRILAELRGVAFESAEQVIQYDQAASVPWISTALWTVDSDGGPFNQVAVYSAGVSFPDFATKGFFGIPVDKVGFAGGTFGSEFPPTTLVANVRSDGGTEITGELTMAAEVGGDTTGGTEAAFVAGVTGSFRFDPDLTLESLTGTLTGELSATTPKIPFPPPASFVRAQGKIGLSTSATVSIIDDEGQLAWPSDLILALEPSVEAIASLDAGPASVEIGAGGSIRGEFSLAGDPCVPLGGEVAVFVRVAASFLVFEAEKSFTFPFTLPACGGASGEGELNRDDLASIFSDVRLAPRYLSTVYGPIEGEDPGNGLPTILYPFAKPSLARNDDGTMTLVFVGEDPAKPTGQQLEIFAAHYDGSNWSAPLPLTDDTLLDDTPSVTYDNNGNAVAVWSRVKTTLTDPANTDPASLLDEMEIVYSVYDSNSSTWSSPQTLTDNSEMDYLPTIQAGADGSVMAAWLYDADSNMPIFPDDAAPLDAKYRFATWNGSNWSTVATAVSGVATNESPRLALGDGEAILVWSEDGDRDVATSNDRDIQAATWDGSSWSTPSILSTASDGIADLNPNVIYFSGDQAEVTWVRTGVPLSESDGDVTDELVSVTRTPAGFSQPRLALSAESISSSALTVDEDGSVIAVWQGRSATGPDLFYARATGIGGDWSVPIQITDNVQLEWQLNPYVDDSGELQVIYLERNVGSEPFSGGGDSGGEGETHDTVPVFVGSALHFAGRSLGNDLEADDIEIIGTVAPGTTVQVRAVVRNRGDRPSPEVPAVLLENGNVSGPSQTIPPLASGEQVSVSFDWLVPSSPTLPVTLAVHADSSDDLAETNEANNVASLITLQPDLSVSSVQAFYDQGTITVVATVENSGLTPTLQTTQVALRLDDADTGPQIATATIPPLAARASTEVTIRIDDALATLNVFRTGYLLADSGGAVSERDEANNAAIVGLNPYDSWQNPVSRFDVNNDGFVTPRDALLQILDLNTRGARRLPVIPSPPLFLDTSGDNLLSPHDVILVIFALAGEGEGEPTRRAADDEWLFSEREDWTTELIDVSEEWWQEE